MLVNAAVQHRVKHFDQLLTRELGFLQKQYEQHLITLDKFERTIRHENGRAKVSLPLKEIYDEQTETVDYQKLRQKKGNNDEITSSNPLINDSSIYSPAQSDILYNEPPENPPPKIHRRLCTKAHRLPPIVKATVGSHRLPRPAHREHHWMSTSLPPIPKEKNLQQQGMRESRLTNSTNFSGIDEQIQTFMQKLPSSKEIHHGFDSFGASSLYSTRGQIVMR